MRFLRDLVNSCYGLPLPLRMGLLLIVGGGSASMIGYVLSSFMGRASWIMVGGAIGVIILVMLFALLVKWLRKRKADPMQRDILGQAASTPAGVSAASRRAALDDLRRNFEAGIAKFRAAGKNLYSLPWYVVVGEPGSGKTEAIRHSCIGFPPGLHDPLQGAGGTINMNWWFTDKAVILDTAGRLMFEEIPAGSTSEWQEFLRLLRSYRYNCPINGLILVIPADTLITDTADQIKSKANKIAEQLHLIQRILEVRFPVFVMITKCDLINGFREFFDGVTDPDLQQQILGWSNPAPLDERFNPELVSQHLELVCDRLRRRRLGLLIDPVHTEDPAGHRVDQVDALYALPQSLSRLAPRLRHYLDHVFAGGEWTGKPLFLRGIYFTSSMREGNALDEELAEALGVPVQSIQEGREWERERSYFLKDFFLEKVFKERGLVTRASHAGKQRRRRQAIVLFAGIFSVLILGLFTWLGARALRDSIGIHRDYWVAAADKPDKDGRRRWHCWRPDRAGDDRPEERPERPEYWQPIVTPDVDRSSDFRYRREVPFYVGGEQVRVAEFHAKLVELAERPIKVPWIFWFARLGTDLTANRAEAQQLLLERSVVRPLVDAVRHKLALPRKRHERKDTDEERKRALDDAGWPDKEFSPALAQLIRLECPDGELPDLDALFQCALYWRPDADEGRGKKYYEDNWALYCKDREALARVMRWMYRERREAAQATPQQAAAAGTAFARLAISDGLTRYIHYWARYGDDATKKLDDLMKLKELLLKDYKEAERRLLETDEEFAPRLDRPTENKVEVVGEALAAWEKRLKELQGIRDTAEKRLAAFPDGPIFPVFQKNMDAILKEVAVAFATFRQNAGVAEAAAPSASLGAGPAAEAKPAAASAQAGQDAERWRNLAATVNARLDDALARLKKDVADKSNPEDVRRVDAEFLGQQELPKTLFERLVRDGWLQSREGPRVRLYKLRDTMYRLGDAERGKGDAAAEIGSLAKGVEAVEGAVAAACSQVAELSDIKPDAFWIKDAHDVSVFTAQRLAMPQRIYRTLYEALSKAPDTPERVAVDVEKASEGLDALTMPKLPATGMNGGPFDRKFHPEAVKKVIRVCREAGQVLSDPKRVILDRDTLDTRRALWLGVINQYVTGPYLGYWTQTVPRGLESHGKDWASYRAEIRELKGAEEIFMALSEVGAALRSALHSDIELALSADAKNQFAAARETVQAQARKLTNEVYTRRCGSVRSNWLKLDDDPFKARSTLAVLSDDEIFEAYLPFESKNPEEFADKYWTGLTVEFLRLLSEGASEEGKARVAKLRQGYARFPLDRPAAPEKPEMPERTLTAAQVGEAREIVDTLVLRWKDVPTPAAPEGEGVRRGRETVRRMIEEIRKLRIPPAEWEWVKKVKAVLDGLPTADRALKCELWIPAAQPSPNAANLRWVHIRVKQGDKEVGKGNTIPAADYKLCDLWYPGNPGEKLEVFLYRNPVDPEPSRMIRVDNLWAMVRLLHPGQLADPLHPGKQLKHFWDAERPSEKKEVFDPVKRNVILTIQDDEGQQRQLRLRLEFEKGLPRIEDWPSSAGGQ